MPTIQELEAYIRKAAQARGIDPDTAVRVAKSEGLQPGAWQSNYMKNGVREPSYGPFQLYKGGGLGNDFQKATGLDPADPATVQPGIDFALDNAAKGGWGPWYGAKRAGIGRMEGIGKLPPFPQQQMAQAQIPQTPPAPQVVPPQSSPSEGQGGAIAGGLQPSPAPHPSLFHSPLNDDSPGGHLLASLFKPPSVNPMQGGSPMPGIGKSIGGVLGLLGGLAGAGQQNDQAAQQAADDAQRRRLEWYLQQQQQQALI